MCRLPVPALNPGIVMGIVTCGRANCTTTARAQQTLYELTDDRFAAYFVRKHGMMLYDPLPADINTVDDLVARIRDQHVVQSIAQCRTVNP